MIWPAMLFNLCVGLLFAGYLLRAVRRYERRADAIMAKLDRLHEERLARIDHEHEEEMHKYDIAREEIKASMRVMTDQAIAEMTASTESARAARQEATSQNGLYHATPGDDRETESPQLDSSATP